ncbi:MAG: Signal transduction histidine kinase [Xanthobacteraceae bacterium]|jgi:CheY-like chemotaxis protein|nr:Signal transduction histidine kinase [Xanthobacteraceae bacterium]
MGDDLVSVRLLVVSEQDAGRDLLRYGATLAPVPVEVIEAPTSRKACGILKHEPVDLVCLDAALGPEACAHLICHAKAARRPPFVAVLGTAADDEPEQADGLAAMPSSLDEARELMARLLRVRLPKRALVVDDSSTIRCVVRKILAVSQFRLEVTDVADGMTALKLAKDGHFNLVFLDCNMPGLDGLATLAELKRAPRGIDVVMMNPTEEPALVERARALGAAFLKKPFYPPDIDRVLRGFYGLRARGVAVPSISEGVRESAFA